MGDSEPTLVRLKQTVLESPCLKIRQRRERAALCKTIAMLDESLGFILRRVGLPLRMRLKAVFQRTDYVDEETGIRHVSPESEGFIRVTLQARSDDLHEEPLSDCTICNGAGVYIPDDADRSNLGAYQPCGACAAFDKLTARDRLVLFDAAFPDEDKEVVKPCP